MGSSSSPSNSSPRTRSDWSRGAPSQTEKSSKRLPSRQPLVSPSWDSSVSLSSSSTSPSTTSSLGHNPNLQGKGNSSSPTPSHFIVIPAYNYVNFLSPRHKKIWNHKFSNQFSFKIVFYCVLIRDLNTKKVEICIDVRKK